MHTYYQTTLALVGTRSSQSSSENATDWDFTANSLGQVSGVYERIKETYVATQEVHPQSSFSSYSQTITDSNFGNPPTLPGSQETRIFSGGTSSTVDATSRYLTRSSFGSTSLSGQAAVTESWSSNSPPSSTPTASSSYAYTSASGAMAVQAATTSSSEEVVSGIVGTVINGAATTSTNQRTISSFFTVATTITRSSRVDAATVAFTTTQYFPVGLHTVLEAEPHDRGYAMTGTAYSQGFPANIANSFLTSTLSLTTFTQSFEPVASSSQTFNPSGVRTTTSEVPLVTTTTELSTLTHFSADGWWPMTATQTELLTRISTINVSLTLQTTKNTTASIAGYTFSQETVYTTIYSTAFAPFSVHLNPNNNEGGIAEAHQLFGTVVTIHTEFTIPAPLSTIGTSTYGTGTYNSYSTDVSHNGRTSLVTNTSSSTHSVSGLTSDTSSTQFNPSWTERGTLQTSREDYYTSTSILSSLSSTTTNAVLISRTTIFGQSTEHYQTTRDIRSSHSTESGSGLSYYTLTSSATDSCNIGPQTITASGEVVSNASVTSRTFSSLIHNAATSDSQLYTSSSETTYTDTCNIAPGLSVSSGETSVASTYISRTYGSTTHNAVLTPSSSLTTTYSSGETAYCTHQPGTETVSGETTEATRTSQTFATTSHVPLTTVSSTSTATTESIFTETCNIAYVSTTASGATTNAVFNSEVRSSTYGTTVHNGVTADTQLYTSSSETTFTETCAVGPGLSTSSGQTSSAGSYISQTYRSTTHNAVLIASSSSTSTSVFYDNGACTDLPGTETTLNSTTNATLTSYVYITTSHVPSTVGSVSASFSSSSTNLDYCYEYPPGTETQSGETTNATLTSQTFVTFSHDPLVTYSSGSTGTTESIFTETCNVFLTTYTASGATTNYAFNGQTETRSSTFATTVHDASFVNFNISYDTTLSSFTEVCGISNSLEEQSTTSTADNGLTAHTLVTYYATLHSAPNPHTVTRMTYGTFVTYQTTYGSHTITLFTSVITITNSSTAGNYHFLTRSTARTSSTDSYTSAGLHYLTYSTEVTLSTIGTTYGTHTVTELTLYSSTIPSSVGQGTHSITLSTSVLSSTYSSSAPGQHYITSSTAITSSTIGTTYGTHTVTELTLYTSTVPSSVGFGTHTSSWETHVTTTTSSSGQTTSIFTNPALSYVSSSASYSETTITTTETLSVQVNSTYLGTPTVTLGSTVFTVVQGLTYTRVSRFASFANPTVSVVSNSPIFQGIWPRSTREFADAGISPLLSWAAPRKNMVPSYGLPIYLPLVAQGRRHPSFTNFYRLSLVPGSSSYSSGASRSTISYLSSDVLTLLSHQTTAASTTLTNTFESTFSFSFTGTSGYYAPIPGATYYQDWFSGTGHFGGVASSTDTPGSFQLPPGIWHFTSQVNGSDTSEVSSWLQSLSTFSTSIFGLKLATAETEALRYCSRAYDELGQNHVGTFSIPLYHKGYSTDSTYYG